jgi:hypothetical protein
MRFNLVAKLFTNSSGVGFFSRMGKIFETTSAIISGILKKLKISRAKQIFSSPS